MSNFNHLTDHLLDFIDELRAVHHYNIGLEQFITVQNLIMALTAQGRLPAKLADLQTFLAPVLCHSPKEQEDFAQHFADWVRRVETITEEVQPQPVLTLETELKSISRGMTFWKWMWGIVLVLVLTLIPMELFKLDKDISELQSPQTTKSIDKTTPSASTEVKPSVSPESLVPQTTLSQNIWDLKWSIGLTLSLPLLLFLSWWLWWQYQVHRFLARKTVSTQPDLQQFLVQGHQHQLFSSVPLQRVAQGLRKHFTLPTSHLDVKTTLAKTIQAGGWFTPVMGTVQTSPEYLVLIDRTTFRDHQAEFINTLVKRLEAEEVFITRYYFDADPRRCYPEQPQLPPLTLPELAGRYPQHRLLIFTDGQGFIHPITGELAGWLTQLSDWSQRTLFTLEAQPQWGYREKLLEDEAGFLVLPANEAGLTVLVEYVNEQRKADLASSSEAPFPEMLIDRPRRYLERHAPEAETVTELLAQVRQFLGEQEGYDWFSACAVYPELRWQLTLYLGEALQVLNEERLAKLARLSWFRYGYMPNWLREKLVKDLSLAQERKIRETLQVLLLTAVEGGKGEFRLEVAREQKKSLVTLWQRVLSVVVRRDGSKGVWRDYVFLTFMEDRLAVKMPKILKSLISDYAAKEEGFFSFPMRDRRLVAWIIDWLVLLSILVPVLFSNIMGTGYFWATVFSLSILYRATMESSPRQTTLGKLFTGIKVTNLNGSRISFAKALTRNLGKLLFGVIIAIILSMTVLPTFTIIMFIIDGMARRITWLVSENVLVVIILVTTVVAVFSGMVDAIKMDLHNRLSGCMVVMKMNLHNRTSGRVAVRKKRWKLVLSIASFVVIFILFSVSLFISVLLVKKAIDRPQTSSSTGCEIVEANGPLYSFFIKRNGEELKIEFYSELQVGDEIHIRKPTTVEKELIDKYYGGKQWLKLALSNGKVITLEYKDTPYTCLSFPLFRKVSYTSLLEEVIRGLFFSVVTVGETVAR